MKDCTLTHSLLPKCICELECCNFLLGNPCIPHGSDQHCPCGSWVPLAPHHLTSPSCTAFSFCGLAVKHAAIVGASSPTLSRTTLPCIACSHSAHMFYEEHEMVWTTCRESKTLHIHAMPQDTHTRMYADCDRPTHTAHNREHHSPATYNPSCVCIVCSG